jgi:putative phosphoesterase
MRIAVLSDTHDRLPAHLRPLLSEADEIWHLGDVCSPMILMALENFGPPVRVVRGNCDDYLNWPLFLNLERAGRRIRLEHIPPQTPPAGFDLLLHGHTHVPRDEVIGGVRFLNPGCISRANRGAPASFAWLELEEGKEVGWTVLPV